MHQQCVLSRPWTFELSFIQLFSKSSSVSFSHVGSLAQIHRVILWHPPVCQNYNTQRQQSRRKVFFFLHRGADSQSNKEQRRVVDVSVALIKNVKKFVCVSQDVVPPTIKSILRKSRKFSRSNLRLRGHQTWIVMGSQSSMGFGKRSMQNSMKTWTKTDLRSSHLRRFGIFFRH